VVLSESGTLPIQVRTPEQLKPLCLIVGMHTRYFQTREAWNTFQLSVQGALEQLSSVRTVSRVVMNGCSSLSLLLNVLRYLKPTEVDLSACVPFSAEMALQFHSAPSVLRVRFNMTPCKSLWVVDDEKGVHLQQIWGALCPLRPNSNDARLEPHKIQEVVLYETQKIDNKVHMPLLAWPQMRSVICVGRSQKLKPPCAWVGEWSVECDDISTVMTRIER